MPPAARRVEHLRLRSGSRQSVQRVLPALEDALRTASLPDAGGRLVLVRRLELGRIAADAAPATLALAVEHAMAAVQLEAVPAQSSAAATASAVSFRDPLQAHVALGLRLLVGPPPNEWYWPLAVPAWTPELGAAAGLRVLAQSLSELPEAAVALPAWFAALEVRGHAPALRAVFGRSVEARLSSTREHGVAIGSAATRDAELPMQTPHARADAAVRDTEIFEPMRPDAMAQYLSRAVPGATQVGENLAAVHAAPTSPMSEPGKAQDNSREQTQEASTSASERVGLAENAASELSAAPATALAPAPTVPPDAPIAGQVSAPDESPRTLTTEFLDDGLPTSAAGIAFVLVVLQRLGYAQWLAANPDWQQQRVAHRVLGRLLARLGVALDDPAWGLAGEADEDALLPTDWIAPIALSSLALRRGHRPLCLDPPSATAPLDVRVVALWARAVHRWLRLRAHMSLADLVRRPARLQLTPTHVDLHFELRLVDIGVRRAGLDLDPGWLPWYGRVVGFHYRSRE